MLENAEPEKDTGLKMLQVRKSNRAPKTTTFEKSEYVTENEEWRNAH